jgi:DNA transformation protein and related proteins
MAFSAEFRDHVIEMLDGAGNVTARRMFGGAGIYLDGTIIGLIADDVLYFKVDEENRGDYEANGMGPFVPFDDGRMTMPYWQVPAEVLDDGEQLIEWARKSWEAGRRSAAKKETKKR